MNSDPDVNFLSLQAEWFTQACQKSPQFFQWVEAGLGSRRTSVPWNLHSGTARYRRGPVLGMADASSRNTIPHQAVDVTFGTTTICFLSIALQALSIALQTSISTHTWDLLCWYAHFKFSAQVEAAQAARPQPGIF